MSLIEDCRSLVCFHQSFYKGIQRRSSPFRTCTCIRSSGACDHILFLWWRGCCMTLIYAYWRRLIACLVSTMLLSFRKYLSISKLLKVFLPLFSLLILSYKFMHHCILQLCIPNCRHMPQDNLEKLETQIIVNYYHSLKSLWFWHTWITLSTHTPFLWDIHNQYANSNLN